MSADSWQTPSEPFVLPSHTVHVWRAELTCSPNALELYTASLSADEQERAARFRFETDRASYIAARGILRQLLAGYLATEPQRLTFDANAFGKPLLTGEFDPSLQFNLSHSGGIGLFAFARHRRVGVDVEFCRPNIDFNALAESVFSPQERQFLRLMPADYRAPAFFACWTRKEAYIKAQGQGMALALDSFDVSLTPGHPQLLATRPDPDEAQRWTLLDLAPGFGCAAALVVEGERCPVSLRTYFHTCEN
jgi:4'-phosphopantetheinyl transferase